MQHIFDTNENFPFENMILTKPTVLAGGNHFIRFLVNQQPIYIQPPKCKTKQGILRVGKRFYTDLVFTHENENFIQWMENLETYCQEYIYKNRKEWFEGDMEMHDVETYFSSPLKIYKSGKYYIARVNITPVLGKPSLKIYDEQEQEVEMGALTDKTDILTILEIQGIKCSARSFQIEMEVKQILVLRPVDIFEKCLLTRKPADPVVSLPPRVMESVVGQESAEILVDPREDEGLEEQETTEQVVEENVGISFTPEEPTLEKSAMDMFPAMEEIEIPLEDLTESESIQIKERNDVYYEMYREARRKAKIARDLALSSYLEAKRIKNTYMLDDIQDSDEESESGSEKSEEGETTLESATDLEEKKEEEQK